MVKRINPLVRWFSSTCMNDSANILSIFNDYDFLTAIISTSSPSKKSGFCHYTEEIRSFDHQKIDVKKADKQA